MKAQKLKITSNGTTAGTKIILVSDETETEIRNCSKLTLTIDAQTASAKAVLEIFNAEVDIFGDIPENLELPFIDSAKE